MKIKLLFLSLYVIVFAACEKEVVEPSGIEDCDIEIGSYHIRSTSFDAIPYYNKSTIIFEDVLGRQIPFKISEANSLQLGGTYVRYNVNEPGDTVKYCYTAQRKRFSISNDSLEINFSVSLTSTPYYNDPQSGRVADLLDIYFRDLTEIPYKAYQVFYKMVDQRTYPDPFSSNELFPTIKFHGKEFHNVEKTNFSNPKLTLFYNEKQGIVAFRDKTDRLWRFDKMD